MKKSWLCAVNILLPLILGALIYAAAGSGNLPGRWLRTWTERLPGVSLSSFLPPAAAAFARNWFCDFLWAYALTFAVSAVLGGHPCAMAVSAVICICFEILSEAGQSFGWFPGTGDILDAVSEAVGTALALTLIKIFIFREEKDEKHTDESRVCASGAAHVRGNGHSQ